MNAQISRLAVAALVMVSALIVGTTYWQAWAAPSLADRQDNAIKVVAQFTIKRGNIYASDGRTVLARNVRRRVQGKTFYLRRYPQRFYTAHAVGYSTRARSRTGLERSRNDFLTGANANLSTIVDTALDRVRGATIEGNHVVTTIRMRAQRVAIRALAGQCGAAAAIDPTTGKVLVLASTPSFDPNLVERNFGAVQRGRGPCSVAPLLDRATAGLFIPGSTFKVVTAAAALDSERFQPESTFYDPGYCIEYGKRVNNYDTSTPFGRINFTTALQHSVNSAFCEMGKRLGPDLIVEYAKRFGFYEDPPIDLPGEERAASGLYQDRALLPESEQSRVDPGRFAFGQERLLVTPLQMAMVSGAIANGGIVMEPYLTDRVLAPDRRSVVTRTQPDRLRRAIRRGTARELAAMMEAVVSAGTGTAAQISGVRVGGKTGTAETGRAGRNTVWFTAFAGRNRPEVAIAVVLQNQSGTGGTVAAPIAKQIMEALLRPASNTS